MQPVLITSVIVRAGASMIFSGTTPSDGCKRRFVASGKPLPLARAPVPGETWRISGTIRKDRYYGPQVHVTSGVLDRPSGRLLVHLLQGPAFHDVGELTATKLWEAFGERLYAILDGGEVDAMLGVLGTSQRALRQADTLVDGWRNIGAESNGMSWLDRHGVPPILAGRIIACLGTATVSSLEEDPYRLTGFLVPWKEADRLARSMGVERDDRRRLGAAVEACLHDALGARRDTLVPGADLRRALGGYLDSDLVRPALETAAGERVGVRSPDGWQALGPAVMEAFVAERVAAAPRGPATGILDADALSGWERSTGVGLTAGQRAAVEMATSNRLSVLVGGAGVGKTTVLRAIADLVCASGSAVVQMALSGRAALRVAEATGHPARTIHGFLQLAEGGKLDLGGDPLVVVDEASMLDVTLAYRIMRATEEGGRLLLVGDPGQLPPIGPGLVLHVLASAPVPQTRLDEVMRQAAATGIPDVAASVRSGRPPRILPFAAGSDVGVSMVECARDEVTRTVQRVCRELSGEVQVIGAFKGDRTIENGGTRSINAAFHAEATGDRADLVLGRYAPGEPVMWRVNDHDRALMNGELGEVLEGDAVTLLRRSMKVRFPGQDVELSEGELDRIELAYAVTAHKAQGSAFERVVIPVVEHRLLDRTLVYTALTRARRQVVFIGDGRALERAIREEPKSSERRTAMRRHLDEAFARMQESAP